MLKSQLIFQISCELRNAENLGIPDSRIRQNYLPTGGTISCWREQYSLRDNLNHYDRKTYVNAKLQPILRENCFKGRDKCVHIPIEMRTRN